MQDFTRTLLTRRDQALEASRLARTELIDLLDDPDEPDVADAIASALARRSYASWWSALIDHIEDSGTEPVAALANARLTAHDVLLLLSIPRYDCPYASAQALTFIEAARTFFHETADLHPSAPRTRAAAAEDPHGP